MYAGVSSTIFTRIIAFKSTKEIWDYLNEEYARNERMQILNLMRGLESQKIKEYLKTLLGITNKIKLLGRDFAYSRIDETPSLKGNNSSLEGIQERDGVEQL